MTFVSVHTDHGQMIVSTTDRATTADGHGYGVSHQLLTRGRYDPEEVAYTKAALDLLRRYRGPGVIAVDGGANLGVFSLEWARHMDGWGSVIAFEPQMPIFMALCGSIMLNNLGNVTPVRAALSHRVESLILPHPDYSVDGSFGSFSLTPDNRDLGQELSDDLKATFPFVTLDSTVMDRVDLIKLDVEGMELDALMGGLTTICRFRPILVVEHIKCEREATQAWIRGQGYEMFDFPRNWVCVHRDDNVIDHVRDWRVA